MHDDAARQARRASNTLAREELAERLDREGAPDLSKPLHNCGQHIPLTCTHCGSIHETETKCMNRICPSCAPLVSAERKARWGAAVAGLQWPLFITLTLPNSEDPEQLTRLKKGWQKFRRRKIIASRIKGGVATYEVTNKGNGWHPHLHAVADCRWLAIHTPEPNRWDSQEAKEEKGRRAQEELSAAWADCIGEPEGVVWVRRVWGDQVANEILKYAVKGSELITSPDPIAPLIRVLKKTRTLAGWGSLHPLPSPDDVETPAAACSECGVTHTMVPSEIVSYLTRGSAPIDNRTTAQTP